MGFGSSPLGAAPAGTDPVVGSPAAVSRTPAALKLDGATLDFALDADGQYVGAHPVDTKVWHRLRIRSKSMRSAATTGNGVANRQYIDQATIAAEITDEVRLVLADMVEAGDIADRGIEIDTSIRGRVQYVYNYFNRRTGKTGSVPVSR